jgi:ribosomal protein S18 acetylase RimI-like enzyme
MQIVNSTVADMPALFEFYDIAREYQRKNSNHSWQAFDPVMLEQEINEKRQWKMMDGDTIACIFMTAYQDPFIWGERDKDPSVYLHRIVTNPDFRGQRLVEKIIEWTKEHGKQMGKQFIRMDTWGDNPKLIEYYQQCGFRFLEIITPESTENLPPHYSCISLSLFEITIE